MNTKLRYAFYGRVSTAIQAERDTIRLQIHAYEQHRKAHDYTPTKIYEDEDQSGELPLTKRTGGRELLADAKARAFDVLVVYSISRLARTALESLAVVKRLKEEFGISFMSISEPFDTSTPAGWLAFTNMAAIYEFEKATILDRTRKGKEALLREGILPDGMTRYGWRRQNLDRFNRKRGESRLVEDELEAPVVREVFRLCTVERMGSVYIADLLNARGVPTTMTGKRLKEHLQGVWHPAVVRRILRCEAYVTGLIPYNKTKRVKKDGEVIGRTLNDEEQWGWITAPPLIDRDTFNLAQELLGANLRKMNKNGVRKYPLRGRFLCLRCEGGLNFVGRTHTYTVANGEKRQKPYYSCLSRWKRGSTDRCNANLNAPDVERQVWEQVKHLLLNAGSYVEEAVAELERRNAQDAPAPNPEDDLEHVTAALERAEVECKRIRDMVRTGFATQEEAAEDMGKVRAEMVRLKAIQARLVEAPGRIDRADVAQAARMALHFLERLKKALAQAEDDEQVKEELIRSLLIRIEVDGPDVVAVYDAEPPASGTSNQGTNLSRYSLRLHVRRVLELAA